MPVLGVVPGFTLFDQSGQPFLSETLAGRPWIADFIYSRCTTQCPMMTQSVKRAQKALPDMRFVSFTLDPRDSPKVLRDHTQKIGASWTFLTGRKDAVKRLSIDGFKLAAADGGPTGDPISHSKYLVLIDAQGRIRGYYDALDEAAFQRLIMESASL